MTTQMIFQLVAVGFFVVILLSIGLLGMKKTHSFTDFFLGGRDVGPWFTAFTYGTAYFSAVLFIGFAGKIGYSFGMSALWVTAGNALIGVFLTWFLIGERIRAVSLEMNIATMPEYLERRYNSSFLKVFAAASIFIFFIPYTAAVYMGLSYLFVTYFGLPYWMILIFMAVFTGLYMILGGYKSMILVDMIFGIIMLAGVLMLLFLTTGKAGGFTAVIDALSAQNPKLTEVIGPPGLWPLFCLVFLTSVAPMAMPQLIQKFYAIKDKRSIRIGMFASTAFAIIISGVAYFTGILSRILIKPESHPEVFKQVGGKLIPDFDKLMPNVFISAIPDSLSIVILLLILSASMSTLAALVIISGSTVAKDLYAGFINKSATDKTLTGMMRVLSGIFLVLSVILALLEPGVIVTILAISWGAVASVFLGPFLWGLFTTKINRTGAILSGVVSLAVCLTLFFYWGMDKSPQAGTIGMLTSLVTPPLFTPIGWILEKK